jgi:hypothetical protein
LFAALRKLDLQINFSFVLMIFGLGFIFDTLNILRQTLAFSIVAYSLQYIQSGERIRYIIGIFLATTIHYSSIIFYFLYFFIRKDLFKNVFLFSILFFLTNTLFISGLFKIIPSLLLILGYDSYVLLVPDIQVFSHLGLGMYLFFILDLAVIVYYHLILKHEYPRLLPYANLFQIGVILSLAFASEVLSHRIIYYFISMRLVVYSVFFVSIIRKQRTFAYSWIFIVLLLVVSYFQYINSEASNQKSFYFFFQKGIE